MNLETPKVFYFCLVYKCKFYDKNFCEKRIKKNIKNNWNYRNPAIRNFPECRECKGGQLLIVSGDSINYGEHWDSEHYI